METDNNLILSHDCWIRLLVTSMNLIHSWGVYSIGWKLDGIPGAVTGAGRWRYEHDSHWSAHSH